MLGFRSKKSEPSPFALEAHRREMPYMNISKG
jgi:hypothetical protein